MQDADGIPRFYGARSGVVVDNVDPKGLYRCRLRVDGVAAKTGWAYPMCTIGGGGPQRGGFVVPEVGADVVVMFLDGDLERPLYMPSFWSSRAGESEMPLPAKDTSPSEAHLVSSLQLGRLVFSVDERDGQRKLAIEDTVSGDAIVWDLEKQGLRIKMSSAVIVETDGLVRVNGTQVTVQNRLVQITAKPV